jgi:hypothetical protein
VNAGDSVRLAIRLSNTSRFPSQYEGNSHPV